MGEESILVVCIPAEVRLEIFDVPLQEVEELSSNGVLAGQVFSAGSPPHTHTHMVDHEPIRCFGSLP